MTISTKECNMRLSLNSNSVPLLLVSLSSPDESELSIGDNLKIGTVTLPVKDEVEVNSMLL